MLCNQLRPFVGRLMTSNYKQSLIGTQLVFVIAEIVVENANAMRVGQMS